MNYLLIYTKLFMAEALQTASVDPFSTELKGLGGLYKQAVAASTKPTQENQEPPLNALQTPESAEDRTTFSARIRELFAMSLARSFTPDELQAVLANIDSIMPSPEDPNYAEALQNRCHGVLTALKTVAEYRHKFGAANPEQRQGVMGEVARLCADKIDNDSGMPVRVNELPIGVRDPLMCERVGRVKGLVKSVDLKAENAQLYLAVVQKYAKFGPALRAVTDAFKKNVDKFTADLNPPEYVNAQWFNVLLTNLSAFDASKPDTKQRLDNLAQALAAATDKSAFTTAINNFGK
jgi:hypothetical protein